MRIVRYIVLTRIIKLACGMLCGRPGKDIGYRQLYLQRADCSKMRVCLYTPLARKENVPGILWIHGGGYFIGAPKMDDFYISRFAHASGCADIGEIGVAFQMPLYPMLDDRPTPLSAAVPGAANANDIQLYWTHDNNLLHNSYITMTIDCLARVQVEPIPSRRRACLHAVRGLPISYWILRKKE